MVIAIDVGTAMVACGLSNENRGQVWVFWLFPVKSMIPGCPRPGLKPLPFGSAARLSFNLSN